MIALLALVAVAAAIAVGVRALQGDGTTGAQPEVTVTAESSATSSPSPTSPAPTRSPATASPTPEPTTSRASATPPVSTVPTANQLERAVTDYYSIVPGDLDAGWKRLTERYRSTTARSRSYYTSFWNDIDRVRASDVTGSPPGTVTATIRYEYADGRVYVERTRYRLVEDDGILKIDRTDVLSSRQL